MPKEHISIGDLIAMFRAAHRAVYHPDDPRGHIAIQGALDGVPSKNIHKILDYEEGDAGLQSDSSETPDKKNGIGI